ncbi:MAG TPA: hypothetical protein VHG89_06550, partial [Verrucomicrobiae bacterium]|nr:hypothetical protein [Verrucomicrobiae bacterium]
TTIKNRHGSAFYFFAILAAGLLPWTILLGWLWRRNHWRSLDENSKEAWLLLSVWAIFTFVLFSLSQSKLPPYILPIFPALAILIARKFFASEHGVSSTPKIAWRIGLISALAPAAIYPLVIKFAFHHNLSARLQGQMVIAAVTGISLFWLASKWKRQKTAAMTAALTLLGFFVVVAEIPEFETAFGWNQTLKPLGRALQENVQPADAVVCWGRLPQGLPFYSGGVISATNRPYFGGMDLTQVPFEFPGNRERLGGLLLPDGQALAELLRRQQRVWLVGFRNTVEQFQQNHEMPSLRLVTRVGQWELWVNH